MCTKTIFESKPFTMLFLLITILTLVVSCHDATPPGPSDLRRTCNISADCPEDKCCLGVCSDHCSCNNGRLDPREICEFGVGTPIENGGCWECQQIICNEGFGGRSFA